MAPEVHLDIVGTFDGQLALRGVQKEGGNRQSKLPVKRITPATRQNADARVHVCVSGHADHDSILVDVHTDRPAFVTQLDAGAKRTLRQCRIECHAIDRDGFDGPRVVDDVEPGR